MAANSPVDPQATTPSTPPSMLRSTRRRSKFSSICPSDVNGVARAVRTPLSCDDILDSPSVKVVCGNRRVWGFRRWVPLVEREDRLQGGVGDALPFGSQQ